MAKIGLLFSACCIVVAGIVPGATAGPSSPTPMEAREGDNTIYFTWNARTRRVTQASSSRRLVAGQEVELLTALVDRTGRVAMRATLKNISDTRSYDVEGRLVHIVTRDGEVIKRLSSDPIHTVLEPGERVRAVFRYRLRSGEYSARTDFVTE